jgi:4-alpha-glucanotransferase
MITDVFAQTARFNVPGPMAESNWAERLEIPVSILDSDSHAQARVRLIEDLIRGAGRS